MSPTLPPEIVSDILCRLPVKSLLRFRCTSKPFCSLIDGPDFTTSHLNRSAQTNSGKSLILIKCKFPLFSVDLRSLERAIEIEHPLKTLEHKTQLIGSCNGMLCLYNSESEIVLWNMSTRKHLLIPYIPIIFPNDSMAERESHRVAYGFGYDSVHDDYKILRIARFRLGSEVVVYGLKSNSWKRVGASFHYHFLYKKSVGLFTEGALHWLIDHPISDNSLIVAFDLATEELREVPCPTEVSYEGAAFEQFGVLEGQICVTRSDPHKKTDVWMLKHYGVKESWVKLISTSQPQLTTSSKCILPLSYLSNGNELLLLQDFNKFLCYDLETNQVKNICVHGIPPSFDATPYVESLVKPLPMVSGDGATTGGSKKSVAKRGGFLSKGFKLVL